MIGPASPTPTGTAQLLIDGNVSGLPVLLSGSLATLPLDTTTLQPGSHVLQVSYSGDANHLAGTSQLATLNILAVAAGFTLSPSTPTLTAAQGTASSTVTLTAVSMGGFHSTISFACTSGLPSGATCLFTPPSVTLTNSTTAATTLSIALAASSNEISNAQTRNDRTPGGLPFRGIATFAGVIVLSFPRRTWQHKRRCSLLVIFIAFSTFGFLAGCGSGVTAGQAATSGAYAVTVAATGGAAVQATTITLTIQ
jgi:hypothetical protein